MQKACPAMAFFLNGDGNPFGIAAIFQAFPYIGMEI